MPSAWVLTSEAIVNNDRKFSTAGAGGSAVIVRSSFGRHVDNAGGERRRGQAGVRLPAAAATAVHVVCDTEDDEETGQTRRAVDRVDDLVKTAIIGSDAVRHLQPT